MKERVLYLIDGSSYIFRAYHAIRSLSTSKGSPTNAIYGFTSMIFKFLKDYSPEYLGIVFDSKGKTFRDEIYPLYKANRDEAPDDFKIQVPKIFEMVDSLGIPQVQIEGYEADDIMGTIAKEMEEKGISVVLVTGDKDFCQLVSEKVTLIDTMRDKKTGIKEVIQRFGVPPESVIDVFALSGDATDNIPGVRGVGEKTASELIGKFRTIESLYENLNELPQRQRDLLEANKESAILSKRLVTIETSIPMSVSLEGFEYKGFNKEKLREIFEELEFKSLLRELGDNKKVQQEIAIIESSGGKVSYDDYHLVLTEMDFDMVLERIDLTKEVSIDLETTSQSPMRAEIVGIALSPASHESYYIPVAHRSTVFDSTKQLNSKYVLGKLKPIVEDNSIKKIGQNLKYEFIVLERNGLRLRGISCDTMVAAHLIDASRLSYSLDELAKYYLEHKTITYKDVTGIGRDKINFEEVELERAKVYACEDADVAMILSKKLASELEKLTLLDVFKDIELKFIEVLARMEMNGVKVNSELLERLSIDFEKSLEKIAEEVYTQVGFRFNLNSPIQLREILFDKLGLPQKKMTKSGEASTDVEVLTELSKFHPVPEKVLEHRGLSKLKSTYIDSFPKLINPRTGRIHTSFNQAGTSTGRLSSSDPNLQNIPVKTPEMRRRSKTINFGIIYGISPFGLSKQLGISNTIAKSYINEYFKRYRKVKSFTETSIREAERQGYAVTILGRRRPIPELKSKDRTKRGIGARAAINTPIQGSAADIIKIAMIKIQERLSRDYRSRMILQVHDELLFEIHESEIDDLSRIIKKEMEKAWQLRVPIRVDIGIAKNWAEAH